MTACFGEEKVHHIIHQGYCFVGFKLDCTKCIWMSYNSFVPMQSGIASSLKDPFANTKWCISMLYINSQANFRGIKGIKCIIGIEGQWRKIVKGQNPKTALKTHFVLWNYVQPHGAKY